MDVTFTEEQQALRAAVSDLLADRCAKSRVRQVMEGATGCDLELHRLLVDMGATDLPGTLELGIVLEECGKAIAPVPLAGAIGVAAAALAAAGGGELLEATRAGDAIPILVLDPALVPEAHVASHLLVVEDGDLVAVDARACDVRQLPTMDATRRLCAVDTGDADGDVIGPAQPALDAALRHGRVALAHELVGVAQACLDMAVEHAKSREQFGKPIGVYQAVSHRCADMFVATELARSHAYFAAWAVDAGDPHQGLAASQAKAAAGESAVFCAQSAIQVHGGIGFTWEHDLHLYLKRARGSAGWLGTPAAQRQLVADHLAS
jgi:alkylation response protein AidB-like acyl-CoA dehydrogenase